VFCATGVTYAIYRPAINEFSGGALLVPPAELATATIFTTFPQTFSSTSSQVFSVVQRTAVMQCVVSALKDDYNLGQKTSSGGTTNFPLNLFFLFFGLTAAFGWQTGYVISIRAMEHSLTVSKRSSKSSSRLWKPHYVICPRVCSRNMDWTRRHPRLSMGTSSTEFSQDRY